MKRFAMIVLIVTCTLSQAWGYSGGSGTEADPYQIANANDLIALGNEPNDYDRYFVLSADIDLSAYTFDRAVIAPDTNDADWDHDDPNFLGQLDGAGHVIRYLTIDASGDYVGLVGWLGTTGRIVDLALDYVDVSGCGCVGGLVGVSEGSITSSTVSGSVSGEYDVGGLVGGLEGTITSCTTTCSVSGYGYVGGLVATNYRGSITSSHSTGSISGEYDTGGLVGEVYFGSITSSYNTGPVMAFDCVGGLVGDNCDGSITSCYNTGSVTGEYEVGGLVGESSGGSITTSMSSGSVCGYVEGAGGLVGYHEEGSITLCYSTGSVDGDADGAGGLVGINMDPNAIISSCYSTGEVYGYYYSGGLVGINDGGTVATSFWDTDTSGESSSDGGTGKTTTEMQTLSTFTSAGWDFNDLGDWCMPAYDYPRLKWEGICAGSWPTLTVSSTTGGSVIVPGEGTFTLNAGEVVTVIAQADTNYAFVQWTGSAVTAGIVTDPTNSRIMLIPEEDQPYTLYAEFVRIPVWTLEVSSTDGGTVLLPGEGQYEFDHEDDVAIEAQVTNSSTHHFVRWSGTAVDAGAVADANSLSTTVTMLDDYTLVAEFVSNDQVLLSLSSTDGGSVTIPGEGAWPYYLNNVAHVTAQVDDSRYQFVGWIGTAVDAGAVAHINSLSTTVTMAGDYTLQAVFKPIFVSQLKVSSSAGGRVVTPGEGTFSYLPGDVAVLEAEAYPGYVFDHWGGSYASMRNPASLVMNQDVRVKAYFQKLDAIYYVDANGPSDPAPSDPNLSDPDEDGSVTHPYDRIQEAIDAAEPNGIIYVRSGCYVEIIDLLGKSLRLIGNDPNGDPNLPYPIIDGAWQGPVVRCVTGENANCVISGFMITGGLAEAGAGIQCYGSSPLIQNCLIVNNKATRYFGGGVDCYRSEAQFINCTIADNQGCYFGGGIYYEDSNNVIINSIVYGNSPDQLASLGTGSLTVTYSDIQGGWSGLGNLDVDPLFIDDYHLDANSPCIDAGDPNAIYESEPAPNGERINLGAYGGTSQAKVTPEE